MDVTVRPAEPKDVPALVDLYKAGSEFGAWFTNPYTGGKEAKYEDLAPWQRWLHGGPWMDAALLGLHLRRYADAHGSVLVGIRGGALAGSIELWPAEEPLPLGPYLYIETLAGGADDRGVGDALVQAALRDARSRDLRAVDIAPLHAGGDAQGLQAAGFVLLLEHRTVHLPSDRRPKAPEYEVLSTAPAYAELRPLIALNHSEPASLRLGNLGNDWAAGLLREVSHPFGGLLRIGTGVLGVTGRVCTWLPQREAELDLWVSTSAVGNLVWFRRAVGAAVDYVGKHHRVSLYRTTVPSHLVPALRDLGFEDGDAPDPWLRCHLDTVVNSSNL